MTSIYRLVMDAEANPLRTLPAAQRFQIMSYLGIMWTVIFCSGTSAWIWFGELVTLHLLMAAGFVVTGWTFSTAQRGRNKSTAGSTGQTMPGKERS